MSDGPLAINLQRRVSGEPTLALVRIKRHGAVSVSLDPREIDELETAIAEAKRLIATEPNRPTYEVLELRHA
jgi:hypothetical protein